MTRTKRRPLTLREREILSLRQRLRCHPDLAERFVDEQVQHLADLHTRGYSAVVDVIGLQRIGAGVADYALGRASRDDVNGLVSTAIAAWIEWCGSVLPCGAFGRLCDRLCALSVTVGAARLLAASPEGSA